MFPLKMDKDRLPSSRLLVLNGVLFSLRQALLLNVECSGYGWWKHYGSYGSSRQTQFCDVHNISPMFQRRWKTKLHAIFEWGILNDVFSEQGNYCHFLGMAVMFLGGCFTYVFIFYPYLGKMSKLAEFFQMSWNQEPVVPWRNAKSVGLKSYVWRLRVCGATAFSTCTVKCCLALRMVDAPKIPTNFGRCSDLPQSFVGFHDFEDGSISVHGGFLAHPTRAHPLCLCSHPKSTLWVDWWDLKICTAPKN